MIRVLVIGAAGYVGRRLMVALHRRADVAAIGADIRAVPGVAEHRIDLAFPAQSFGIVHEARPDVVINLAYLLSAGIVESPQRGVETNIVGVNGLFEACVRLGVRRLVYASSGSVYGDQSLYGDREVDEETPLPAPRTLYQLHKQFNERMAEHYNQLGGTQLVALRISSPHGRGKDSSDFNPLDRLVRAAARGEPTLSLPWSASRPLSFNHVDDVAEACVAVALAPTLRWTIYNLGGESLTVGSLAGIAAARAGLRVTFAEGAPPATFMGRISSRRLEEEVGFRRRSAAEWFEREVAEARAAG